MVHERDGKIRAWLSCNPLGVFLGRSVQMDMMLQPDGDESVAALVDHALTVKGTLYWLVPGYQGHLASLLEHWGFWEVGSFTMLIKTTAARVKSLSRAGAEAVVW